MFRSSIVGQANALIEHGLDWHRKLVLINAAGFSDSPISTAAHLNEHIIADALTDPGQHGHLERCGHSTLCRSRKRRITRVLATENAGFAILGIPRSRSSF
jgi:hypothetical protein